MEEIYFDARNVSAAEVKAWLEKNIHPGEDEYSLKVIGNLAYMSITVPRKIFGNVFYSVYTIPKGATWDGENNPLYHRDSMHFSNWPKNGQSTEVVRHSTEQAVALEAFHDCEEGIETVKHVVVSRMLENQENYPSPGYEARRRIATGRDPIGERAFACGRVLQSNSWNTGLTGRAFEEFFMVPKDWVEKED